MIERSREFRVSADELKYLEQLSFNDESLWEIVKEATPGAHVTIRASPAQAEQLRGFLTERLAEVGFDENYSVNAQGRMLEDLIDRFYVP